MNRTAAAICMIVLTALCACKREEHIKKKVQEVPPEPAVVLPDVGKQRAEGARWVELAMSDGTTILRCMAASGCTVGDKKYPAGSEKRSDAVFCGNAPSFTFVNKFYCDSATGEMRCGDNGCYCGTYPMYEGQFCHEGTVYYYSGLMSAFYPEQNPESEGINPDETDTGETDDELEDESCDYSDEDTESCRARKQEILAEYGRSFACIDAVHVTDETCGFQDYYEALVWCDDMKGCKTPDGRIYSYKMHDAFQRDIKGSTCPYYLSGTADTTRETLCETGDCVWPEDYDYDLRESPALIVVHRHEKSAQRHKILQLFGRESSWKTDTEYEYDDFLGDDEDSGDDTSYNNRVNQVLATFPDVAKCAGGKRYCHGTLNPPVPAPESSEGYVCRQINIVGLDPEEKGQSEDHPNQKMRVPTVREWVCDQEGGCACGTTTCPRGGTCHDGACSCTGVPLGEQNDYACQHPSPDGERYYFATCNGDRCPCGNTQCLRGAMCYMNECYSDIVCPSESFRDHADNYRYADDRCYGYTKQMMQVNSGWRVDPHTHLELCDRAEGCVAAPGVHCVQNATFQKDACICGREKSPGNSFKCVYNAEQQEYEWECAAKDGCGMIYGFRYREGDVFMTPKCWADEGLTPEGCKCGSEMYSDTSYCLTSTQYGRVNVCNISQGCQYGAVRCNEGEYMLDGKCIVPEVYDGAASETYWVERIVADLKEARLCESDHCTCGASECEKQEWCQHDHCYDAPIVSVEYRGHTFHYELSADFEVFPSNDHLADFTKDFVKKMIYGEWQSCAASNDENKPWDQVIAEGDDISNLYCTFAHDSLPEDGDSFERIEHFHPAGYSCLDRSLECACGNVVCGQDESCSCKIADGRLSCKCTDPDGYTIASESERHCAGTIVPAPSVFQYECRSGLGFVCNRKVGCDCGDGVRCTTGAVCVRPGLCTQDVVYNVTNPK